MLKFFSLKSLFFGQTSAPANEAESLQSPAIEWIDDSVLRNLAQMHADGSCEWVLAADMQDLFQHVDAINADLAKEDRMEVRVSNVFQEELRGLIDRGFHLISNNPFGTTLLSQDDIMRAFGPQNFDDIKICWQGRERKAYPSMPSIRGSLTFSENNEEEIPVRASRWNDLAADFAKPTMPLVLPHADFSL